MTDVIPRPEQDRSGDRPTSGSTGASGRLVTGPFLAVTASTLTFFLYIGILVVAMPRYVEDELEAGELGIGLTLAAFAGAAILVRPLIGWAGDRYGRRPLMVVGAVVAGLSGALSGVAGSLPVLLVLRGATGIGEAALFVGAATMVADLSPPHRRAESASYFSVAVFGGLGVGPVLGEWLLADDRFALTFAVAGAIALLAGALVAFVPARVDRVRRVASGDAPRPRARFFHPAAVWPGVVLASGIAGFAAFSAFLPDYARTVGLGGSGGLFAVYSVVCLVLRLAAAKLPERLGAGRSVTIALTTIAAALFLMAAVAEAWGLWTAAIVIGVGMAFMYPSLMALVVNRVDDAERTSALSSFTMFFELGTVVGGLLLGAVAEALGKRAGFVGGAVMCLVGLGVLWRRVADPRRPIAAPAAVDFRPIAGD